MSNGRLPKIDILYEDENCAVINKPPGIMVHSDGRGEGPFLTDWVAKKFPQAVNVGDPMTASDGSIMNRGGIVHRLDRETSGVLIIAKTAEGHAYIKKQFQDRTISKKYLTFVWGEIKEEFGTITRPIGHSGSDFRKWSAQRGIRGETREAETYWTRVWTGKEKTEKFSLVEVEPKTGRTHQIRVHFLAIHHPVVSDSLYTPKHPPALGFNRLALHSRSIEFNTLGGKHVKIVAPLPDDFQKACESLGILESLARL